MEDIMNVDEVVLVGWERMDDGLHKMTLMKGNELMIVEGVMFFDEEELEGSWDNNMDDYENGEEGITLINISNEEVEEYYKRRVM